jgi:hypothetical protein
MNNLKSIFSQITQSIDEYQKTIINYSNRTQEPKPPKSNKLKEFLFKKVF